MIDIHGKPGTDREATAVGRVRMNGAAFEALSEGRLPKGDALAMARTAGIMAAKKTPEIIPLCHVIALSYVGIEFELAAERREVVIRGTARARAATGVEMEALTAVAVAALTIHDMCKALDPAGRIAGIELVRKSGGKAGLWQREES